MPYLMKNGKWRAKRMINGQVRTRVFTIKQEAKKWEAEQSPDAWEKLQTHTACFLDFANAYLDMAAERFVKKTIAEKKIAFRQLFKVVRPNDKLDEMTPAVALDVLRYALRSSSGNAANKVRKNLLAAWEWGKKYYGLPRSNPFRETEKFPADARPRYIPPEADFWKVYAVAYPTDRVLLLFLLHTGARRGEAFRLTWGDVDFYGGKIRLGTRKTAHGGMEYSWVPMTTELHNALTGHKLQNTLNDLVFMSARTGQGYINRQGFMRDLCKRAGVKPFGFHAIRHLSATILAYEGVDIPTVQAILRHHSPTTTAKYIKSLGAQPGKIDSVFAKRAAPKVIPFEAAKTAIGT
jgi:integrase